MRSFTNRPDASGQVELFFKWIKQNLHIKAFYGTSENAVRTQIWIAMCVYLLVSIVKKELKINRNSSEILQILSICLFEKTPIQQVLTSNQEKNINETSHKHLSLFDL